MPHLKNGTPEGFYADPHLFLRIFVELQPFKQSIVQNRIHMAKNISHIACQRV